MATPASMSKAAPTRGMETQAQAVRPPTELIGTSTTSANAIRGMIRIGVHKAICQAKANLTSTTMTTIMSTITGTDTTRVRDMAKVEAWAEAKDRIVARPAPAQPQARQEPAATLIGRVIRAWAPDLAQV